MVVKLNNFFKSWPKVSDADTTQYVLDPGHPGRSQFFFFMGKSYNRFSYSCDV